MKVTVIARIPVEGDTMATLIREISSLLDELENVDSNIVNIEVKGLEVEEQ